MLDLLDRFLKPVRACLQLSLLKVSSFQQSHAHTHPHSTNMLHLVGAPDVAQRKSERTARAASSGGCGLFSPSFRHFPASKRTCHPFATTKDSDGRGGKQQSHVFEHQPIPFVIVLTVCLVSTCVCVCLCSFLSGHHVCTTSARALAAATGGSSARAGAAARAGSRCCPSRTSRCTCRCAAAGSGRAFAPQQRPLGAAAKGPAAAHCQLPQAA